MTKTKKYLIDVENSIIFVTYLGDINLDDIKEIELKLDSDPDFSKSYDRIYDFRHCNLNINVDDIPDYIDFEKNEIKTDSVRKEIYLTSSPNDVVITTIYSILINSFQLQPYIASTTENVSQILSNKSLNKNFIDRILDGLINTA